MASNSPDVRMSDIDGIPIAPDSPQGNDLYPVDRDWVKIAFMVPDADIASSTDVKNRYWSSASSKFVDTRLGCNIGINPRAQWTRYSDIRVPGRLIGGNLREKRNEVSISNVSGNYGIGRAYSEMIDDPSQRIFMRFGVPQFNSLTTFLFRAFDREEIIMARTGRAPTAWYDLGKIVGTAILAIAAPLLTVAIGVGKAINWLMGRQTSKFFTLKPAMHMYWNMVNLLVNNHAVNTGIFARVLSDDTQQGLGKPYKIDEEQMGMISALMPDIFNPKGYIDVYALANKAQRIANALFMSDFAHLNNGTATDFLGYLKRDATGKGTHSTWISNSNNKPSLGAFFNEVFMAGDYFTEDGQDAKQELDPRVDTEASEPGAQKKEGGYIDSLKKYADAEFRDGSQFAVFRVDYTGSVSESFANSVGESEISQKLNGISNQFKEARFSLADGNILGDTIRDLVGAATNLMLGALDGVTVGLAGLIPGLGGSGFIDIPKHWQSSSANLPRGSYKIKLISPYNNPISRMINIWIPFYMILAGAIPRSTGKQSYTSPFYCQLFDRGRLQSKLAMIESLNINRGTSNLGFDTSGQALAIDVTFNVVDLSSIMHMPMSSGSLGSIDMTMDEDNIASDYLNVLAGMDIYSQIYPLPQAQLRMTKLFLQAKQKATSPAFHAAVFKNSVTDGFLNDITFGLSAATYSAMSSLVRGSSLLEGDRTQ